MIQPHKTLSTVGVALAMAVFAGGGITAGAISSSSARTGEIIWIAAVALGFTLWVWGCYHQAKAKGYSGWWGILGLLSAPGLLVLLVLPDRTKKHS